MDIVVERQIRNAFNEMVNGHVCMRNWMLGVEDSIVIAECVTMSKSLKSLGLAYNTLGDAGTAVIASALAECNSLTSLDLSINRMSTGVYTLADAVRNCRSINMLNVSCNRIPAPGIVYLIEAAASNQSISYLDISKNEITFSVQHAKERVSISRPDLLITTKNLHQLNR